MVCVRPKAPKSETQDPDPKSRNRCHQLASDCWVVRQVIWIREVPTSHPEPFHRTFNCLQAFRLRGSVRSLERFALRKRLRASGTSTVRPFTAINASNSTFRVSPRGSLRHTLTKLLWSRIRKCQYIYEPTLGQKPDFRPSSQPLHYMMIDAPHFC